MKNLVILLLFILIIFISGCVTQPSVTLEPAGSQEVPVETPPKEEILKPELPKEEITPTVKEFKISITHGGYSPDTFTVKKGDIVRFLTTSDPVWHNHGITIDAYNINVAVTRGPNESPQVIEFTADKAGTFEIYCKTCLDGWGPHPWMKGTLTVE